MAVSKKKYKKKINNSYSLKSQDSNILHKKLSKIVIILMILAFIIPVVLVTILAMV